MVPAEIRAAVLSIVPVATSRSLSPSSADVLRGLNAFPADVVALGPGLNSLSSQMIEVLSGFGGPCVVDADGLNQLAGLDKFDIPQPHRLVLTPHAGEAKRLLAARGDDREITPAPESRRDAALALVGHYPCTVVLKGRHTIVTNGDRLYINETGNSGLATAGTGDVLTGVIAGLIAQKLNPFEAAILGVYLHGLAADYAAEELGRRSLIATDLLDYLPEAFCEHEMVGME
jgi:NAD(P)H-hydrate epimerase